VLVAEYLDKALEAAFLFQLKQKTQNGPIVIPDGQTVNGPRQENIKRDWRDQNQNPNENPLEC
jgi:hypothetical protein